MGMSGQLDKEQLEQSNIPTKVIQSSTSAVPKGRINSNVSDVKLSLMGANFLQFGHFFPLFQQETHPLGQQFQFTWQKLYYVISHMAIYLCAKPFCKATSGGCREEQNCSREYEKRCNDITNTD